MKLPIGVAKRHRRQNVVTVRQSTVHSPEEQLLIKKAFGLEIKSDRQKREKAYEGEV